MLGALLGGLHGLRMGLELLGLGALCRGPSNTTWPCIFKPAKLLPAGHRSACSAAASVLETPPAHDDTHD